MSTHLLSTLCVVSHFMQCSQGRQTLARTGDTAHAPEMEEVLNKKCLEHGSAPQVWWILVPWRSPSLGSFFVICPIQFSETLSGR